MKSAPHIIIWNPMFEQYPKRRDQTVGALRYGWQTCAGLDERRVVTLPLLLDGPAVDACHAWFTHTFGHPKARHAVNVIRIDDPVWHHDLARLRETVAAMFNGLTDRERSIDQPAWQWCIIAVAEGTAELVSPMRPAQAASQSN